MYENYAFQKYLIWQAFATYYNRVSSCEILCCFLVIFWFNISRFLLRFMWPKTFGVKFSIIYSRKFYPKGFGPFNFSFFIWTWFFGLGSDIEGNCIIYWEFWSQCLLLGSLRLSSYSSQWLFMSILIKKILMAQILWGKIFDYI